MALQKHKQFYLECLEETNSIFSQPLTLFHAKLQRDINTGKRSLTFQEQWNSFRCSDDGNRIDKSVLSVLEPLSCQTEFILQSVGEDIAEQILPFCLTRFRKAQIFLWSLPPFNSITLNQTSKWSETILYQSLCEIFGSSTFKPLQLEAVQSSLEHKDTLCLFPTGYGKSLVFQLPAAIEYGISIVFSPLCSLLADQLQILQRLGIKSAWINPDLNESEEALLHNSLSQPVVFHRVILMTPEMFTQSSKVQNTVSNLYRRHLLKRFVFDEVHCVSHWGRSFRPSYLMLASIRENYTNVPVLALTATANAATIMDIKELLHMSDCAIFRHSFNRKNISLNVVAKKPAIMKDLISMLKNRLKNISGIVYCTTKKECTNVSKGLNEGGIISVVYHSSVKPEDKSEVMDQWMNDEVLIVVATIAFGLGLYIYVVHLLDLVDSFHE